MRQSKSRLLWANLFCAVLTTFSLAGCGGDLNLGSKDPNTTTPGNIEDPTDPGAIIDSLRNPTSIWKQTIYGSAGSNNMGNGCAQMGAACNDPWSIGNAHSIVRGPGDSVMFNVNTGSNVYYMRAQAMGTSSNNNMAWDMAINVPGESLSWESRIAGGDPYIATAALVKTNGASSGPNSVRFKLIGPNGVVYSTLVPNLKYSDGHLPGDFKLVSDRDNRAFALVMYGNVHYADPGRADLIVFTPQSSAPLFHHRFTQFQLSDLGEAKLSPDGSTLALADRYGKQIIFNMATRTVVHAASADANMPSPSCIATSYDGRIVGLRARDTQATLQAAMANAMQIFRRNTDGTYTSLYKIAAPHDVQSDGTWDWCSAAAMSADGERLAIGFNYSYIANNTVNDLNYHVVMVDTHVNDAVPAPVIRLNDRYAGGGTKDNALNSVVMSDDARVIALGGTGDEANLTPELLIYARRSDGAYIKVYSQNHPTSSLLSLTIDPEGQWLGTARKWFHVNDFAAGGFVETYDLAHSQY